MPSDWTDAQVIEFATSEHIEGATVWHIRKDTKLLAGVPERNPALAPKGFVHITLDKGPTERELTAFLRAALLFVALTIIAVFVVVCWLVQTTQ